MIEDENIENIEKEYNNPFNLIQLNGNLPKISTLTSKYKSNYTKKKK